MMESIGECSIAIWKIFDVQIIVGIVCHYRKSQWAEAKISAVGLFCEYFLKLTSLIVEDLK